jgi:hypothetical protein
MIEPHEQNVRGRQLQLRHLRKLGAGRIIGLCEYAHETAPGLATSLRAGAMTHWRCAV